MVMKFFVWILFARSIGCKFLDIIGNRLIQVSSSYPQWLMNADKLSINEFLNARSVSNNVLMPHALMYNYTSHASCRSPTNVNCNTLLDQSEAAFNEREYYASIALAVSALCNQLDALREDVPYPACVIRSVLILIEAEREVGRVTESQEYLSLLMNHAPTASGALRHRQYPLRIRSALSLRPVPVNEGAALLERAAVEQRLEQLHREILETNTTISLFVSLTDKSCVCMCMCMVYCVCRSWDRM